MVIVSIIAERCIEAMIVELSDAMWWVKWLINQFGMALNENFANVYSLELIVIRLLHDNFHIRCIINFPYFGLGTLLNEVRGQYRSTTM